MRFGKQLKLFRDLSEVEQMLIARSLASVNIFRFIQGGPKKVHP